MDEHKANNHQEQPFPDLSYVEHDIVVPLPNYESVKDFKGLYEEAYRQIYHDLKERIAANPVPTDEELALGAFIEELEPQVRDVVLALRRKGYNTDNSGFEFGGGPRQVIDGLFSIPDDIADHLSAMGINVTKERSRVQYTSIGFIANELDLATIKERWNQVVRILPDSGERSKPSMSVVSNRFRLMSKAGTLQSDFMPYWLRDVLGVSQGDHKEIYDGTLHY
jgi:hypothetical protein